MSPRLLFAAIACLAAVSCGGSGSSPTPTVDFTARAREVVPDIPLTLTDLPPGWEDSTVDLTGDVDLSPDCDIFDLAVTFPAAAATARSDPYEGPLNAQLLSYAAVFRTASAAGDAVANTHGLFDRCAGEFEDEVRRLAESELHALGIDLGIFASIDVDARERDDAPALGDASAAYIVSVGVSLPGDDQHFTIDVRVFAEGRTAAAVIYARFGADPAPETLDLAQRLLGKAALAEAKLPPP